MNPLDLNLNQWILAIISALLIGFSKTGLSGVGTLVIPLMAAVFGGKASSGIVLPMLVFGDIIAVRKYHRHADWRYIWELIPWAVGGIALGLAVGNFVSDLQFKKIIAAIVLVGLGIMVYQEWRGEKATVPHQWWFGALLGLAGGFSTMIGNAAGPVMGIYLLAMQLPKWVFIGTGAWFFMIVNLIKVPLQVIFWKGITWDTLLFNLILVPAIACGAYAGVKIAKIIPEKPFRITVIVLTAAAAIKLFL